MVAIHTRTPAHRTTSSSQKTPEPPKDQPIVALKKAGELPFQALASDFHWGADSWEMKLASAADKAGNKNGKTDAQEILSYVANPKGDFITSEQIHELFSDLARAGGKLPNAKLNAPWKRAVADAVGKYAGDNDKVLSEKEFRAWVETIEKDKNPNLPRWLPLQELESMLASISAATGEKHMLRAIGFKDAVELRREYLQIVFDPKKKVPLASAYVLSAADLALRPKGDFRPATFHKDPDFNGSANPNSYTNSHYDRGHQADFEGAVIGQADERGAAWSTMSTTNLAPQTPELNENSWRYLEQSFHEAVLSTGAKAVIVTGSVFLDAAGKPLPPDKIAYIGPKDDRIAVPTHSYKAVLLMLPNGQKQMYGYLVENTRKLPVFTDKDGEEKIQQLLRERRVPVMEIEKKLGGVVLFPALSPAESKRLKAEVKSFPPLPPEGKHAYANGLWPEAAPPKPEPKHAHPKKS
jgi:endonuclease G